MQLAIPEQVNVPATSSFFTRFWQGKAMVYHRLRKRWTVQSWFCGQDRIGTILKALPPKCRYCRLEGSWYYGTSLRTRCGAGTANVPLVDSNRNKKSTMIVPSTRNDKSTVIMSPSSFVCVVYSCFVSCEPYGFLAGAWALGETSEERPWLKHLGGFLFRVFLGVIQ